MQERYEQAIKETFKYLDDCIADQKAKNYSHLGLIKDEIIERQMKKRGFNVKCRYNKACISIAVYPEQNNLPIHVWREK
jgi:hypothetical protein